MRIRALAGVLLGVSLAACGRGEDPLRVGTEANYAPFESVRSDGNLEGFDIDLAGLIAQDLGRPLTIQDLPFDTLIPSLQSDRLDLICSALSWTADRAESIDFSRPYARVLMGVLVTARPEGAPLRAMADLDSPDVRIAVHRGTSGATAAAKHFPRARVTEYETEQTAAHEVANATSHAFVYDMIGVVRQAGIHGAKVRILPGDLGVEEYCVGLRKGSPLTPKVNDFLERASRPGGELDGLFAKWGLDPERFRPLPK